MYMFYARTCYERLENTIMAEDYDKCRELLIDTRINRIGMYERTRVSVCVIVLSWARVAMYRQRFLIRFARF